MEVQILTETLEILYSRYNHRPFVHPDPLEFLYAYPDVRDREIVGLVASALSYGNVRQILVSVKKILDPLTARPSLFIRTVSLKDLRHLFKNFKHRWHTGEDIASLLWGIRQVVGDYGSLENCLKKGLHKADKDLTRAVSFMVHEIVLRSPGMRQNLLPSPQNGSACKRLWMYLRWMIRKDEVDPGGWSLPPSKLVVPLDTHLFRAARFLKMTRRRQADLKTALEVTHRFRKIAPEDPVRYDFVLTRPGIWRKMGLLRGDLPVGPTGHPPSPPG